jgi:hypothetical protein
MINRLIGHSGLGDIAAGVPSGEAGMHEGKSQLTITDLVCGPISGRRQPMAHWSIGHGSGSRPSSAREECRAQNGDPATTNERTEAT